MSATTPIAKLSEHVGETVELRGWLYNKRSSGKIAFLEVRDGSGRVQAANNCSGDARIRRRIRRSAVIAGRRPRRAGPMPPACRAKMRGSV